MATSITLQVRTDVALTLHSHMPPTDAGTGLIQIMKELGVVLKPMHAGSQDPKLIKHFTVEVPDVTTAQRVLARLQGSKALEAAYIKPPDEMP